MSEYCKNCKELTDKLASYLNAKRAAEERELQCAQELDELKAKLAKYENAVMPEEPNYLRLRNGFTVRPDGSNEPTYGRYVLQGDYDKLRTFAAAQTVELNELKSKKGI